LGSESHPGDTGTTPVEQKDKSPSELAEAAKGMAEIADQVKALREGLRSLRVGMLAQAVDPPDDNGELHEVAVELEESAQHLSRAVELVSPTIDPATLKRGSTRDLPLAEGLRALISSLRVAGWSDEQVAAYLRRVFDVPDAPGAVARAWDRSR
jgi:hypothetical protein